MNNTFYSQNDYRNYIAHFGVKGMKWGVRRFQNSNGSYTSAGKRRYGVGDGKSYSSVGSRGNGRTAATPEQKAARRAKLKKAALAVGGAAALAGAGYLAYKHNKGFRNAVQGARDIAKEAKFQAQVRGENAAYVAKKRLSEGVRNAPGNLRQGVRNVRTGAMRAAGNAAYYTKGGNAVRGAASRAASGVRGAASGLAKRARLGAQGLGDVAKEAKFQAQVRGENAAYVAKKRLSEGVRNAPGNLRQGVRNVRTGAMRAAGNAAYYTKGGNAVRGAARKAASNKYVRAGVAGLATGAAIGGGTAAIEAARQRKAREQRNAGTTRRRRR